MDVSHHKSLIDEDPESKLVGNDGSRPGNLSRIVPSSQEEDLASPVRRSIRCERLLLIGLMVTIIVAGSALAAVFVGGNKNDESKENSSAGGDIVEDQPLQLSVSDLTKLCPEGASTFAASKLSDEVIQRRGDFAAMLSEVSGDLTPYSCSPANLAVLYLAGNHLPETLNEKTLLMRYVMTSFYFSLGGPMWRRDDSWLSTEDSSECTWYGVSCNDQGGISEVSLPHNNLLGSLPEDLQFLSSLEILSISQNAVTGTIPASLALLPNLAELEISLNSFSGTMPTDIWKQTNLKILDLAYYGGSLEEIPTEIGLFTKLERFIAPESNIVGTIPTELGRCASLKLLDLSKNQLESTIPTHLGELRELQTLYLSGNAFVDDDESANNDGTPLVVPDEVCTLMETGRLLAFDLKAECPNTEQM